MSVFKISDFNLVSFIFNKTKFLLFKKKNLKQNIKN